MKNWIVLPAVVGVGVVFISLGAAGSAEAAGAGLTTNKISRPLRYTPNGTEFVITNGGEFFNRPLYGGSSAFRVDAGDVPELSLYLPGRGGNLRLGLRAAGTSKWLHETDRVVARYSDGMMRYEVSDRLLGGTVLHLSVVATRSTEGALLRAEAGGGDVELLFAFGGVNGMRGRRDGDIGCEPEPVAQFFQLRPEQCKEDTLVLGRDSFAIRGKPGVVGGVWSAPVVLELADARHWARSSDLFSLGPTNDGAQVVRGHVKLKPGAPVYLGLQRMTTAKDADQVLADYREVAAGTNPAKAARKLPQWSGTELPGLFEREAARNREIATRVSVETPDAFVNASVAALNIAADAVWDDEQNAYLHGGVAWRVRLLGWRVAYAGDALGWHDRTAKHFAGFAKQQNTNPVPAEIPSPEESANLSRNETALHSNGDLTRSHYDMNLVGVDTFFRHLLWTGDLEYARQWWPVIERHLAWERRLFRREFGPEKLPVYEAYCCIWASDDLAYNGGGATHSTAYNLYHNRMAAKVARLLGRDASGYEREAGLIERGLRAHLWLPDRGWYAEWKDLLGLQAVHPNAAAWTFYHTIDSEAARPLEAWQMTRYMETQLPHFPLQGAGVPPGSYTITTTSWMPYTWSLNNVVLAETMHSALGFWQANRPEGAFPLFKGAVLDSMYMGLCPGNVGMCTWFDANRRESQRDFGDGVGTMARTVVEGLFGVRPDLLEGEMVVCPGLPEEWDRARLRHPDFQFGYERNGLRESYSFESRFAKPARLRLQAPARRDTVAGVTVNGQAARWRVLPDMVGRPRIEIETTVAKTQSINIEWKGTRLPDALPEKVVAPGERVSWECPGKVLNLADPQAALAGAGVVANRVEGVAAGTPGHRSVFLHLEQGDCRWWQPVTLEINAPEAAPSSVDWAQPVTARLETVNLSGYFNAPVTQIFRNEYRHPRSPFCSLATPKQGIGSWCHPQDTFAVDDSGLRALAAKGNGKLLLPNGVPLATPAEPGSSNIVFVSRWENYPPEVRIPLAGRSSRAFLLMAGSTSAMQSRFDNGEVVVTYTDGSSRRLALHNPTTWWPIEEDYYIDDYAFRRPEPLPVRVDLKTGRIRVLEMERFKGTGTSVPGGAGTVLVLELDPGRELKELTVRALANEVVIGLMSLTLER